MWNQNLEEQGASPCPSFLAINTRQTSERMQNCPVFPLKDQNRNKFPNLNHNIGLFTPKNQKLQQNLTRYLFFCVNLLSAG